MFKANINQYLDLEIDFKGKKILLEGQEFDFDLFKKDEFNYHALRENKSFKIDVISVNLKDKFFHFRVNNNEYKVNLKDSSDLILSKLGLNSASSQATGEIKAPMPGLIIEVYAKEGMEIKKGDPLLILEAMKMENVLKSPRDGIIKTVMISKGKSVEKNQILVKF